MDSDLPTGLDQYLAIRGLLDILESFERAGLLSTTELINLNFAKSVMKELNND